MNHTIAMKNEIKTIIFSNNLLMLELKSFFQKD